MRRVLFRTGMLIAGFDTEAADCLSCNRLLYASMIAFGSITVDESTGFACVVGIAAIESLCGRHNSARRAQAADDSFADFGLTITHL